MEKLVLKAKKREKIGGDFSKLRRSGFLPAVTYGRGIGSESIFLELKEFDRVFKEAGENTLIDLLVDNKEVKKVLIKEPQIEPVTGQIIHVDLYQVKMTEKIKAEVPLNFIGESEAVRNMDGVLITNKDEIEIECLPGDLPHAIDVDISSLKTFDDMICIKDLLVPKGVTILGDPQDVVALVNPPRSEEELAALEEKPVENIEAVGVVEKKAAKEAEEEEEKPAVSPKSDRGEE